MHRRSVYRELKAQTLLLPSMKGDVLSVMNFWRHNGPLDRVIPLPRAAFCGSVNRRRLGLGSRRGDRKCPQVRLSQAAAGERAVLAFVVRLVAIGSCLGRPKCPTLPSSISSLTAPASPDQRRQARRAVCRIARDRYLSPATNTPSQSGPGGLASKFAIRIS
jgi:hypothetical protein